MSNFDFQTFRGIRKALLGHGLISPKNREMAPYYYSRNGSTARERSPGEVAQLVVRAARRRGASIPTMEATTWCGRWPRTVASVDVEDAGTVAFWTAVAFLIDTCGEDRTAILAALEGAAEERDAARARVALALGA